MPVCRACKEEVDELHTAKVDGRRKRVCEDCLELIEEQAEIAAMSEDAIRDMMGYKGKW